MAGTPMADDEPWWRVLDFWFRELTPAQWFEGGADIDDRIAARFGADVERALGGAFDQWADDPRGRLALIILIDQFTRNVFRDDPRAYAGDAKAQALVQNGLAKGMDKGLTLSERQFFYMPLMHAEDAVLQDRSVALFEALADEARRIVDFARGHRAVVKRYGRFPMRNAALDRATTAAEQAYLDAGGGYPTDS